MLVSKPRYRVKAGSASMAASAFDGGPSPTPPSHNAASTGRRLAGWRPLGMGPNAIIAASGPELVRRSRDLRRNNPLGKRAMDLASTHTVGMGIKPRSLCRNDRVREALTEAFAEWVRVSDADGTLDFYGQQALAMDEVVEAGECFARLRRRRVEDGLPVPFQVQILPAEMVPLDWSGNGISDIVQGIERNGIGRRVAYWTYPRHPGEGTTNNVVMDMTPKPVAAADMCHVFHVARAGQQRGLPWLASAMSILHQVAHYYDAELLRKQMVASIVGFVKKTLTGGEDPAELAAEWGRIKEGLGDLPTVSMEPGTMQYLDPGEDVSFSQPADVGGSFEPFMAAGHRAVAAGAGVLYEELTGNWKDSNDRTFRAQFNTFKRQCRQWQWNLMCAQFNEPIWRRFVNYAVAFGVVKVPKSVTEADLLRAEWRPERWEYIHPKQDIEAVSAEIAGGLTSRQAAVAERGDDVEVVDQQRRADMDREDRLNLPAIGGAPAPDAPEPPPAN